MQLFFYLPFKKKEIVASVDKKFQFFFREWQLLNHNDLWRLPELGFILFIFNTLSHNSIKLSFSQSKIISISALLFNKLILFAIFCTIFFSCSVTICALKSLPPCPELIAIIFLLFNGLKSNDIRIASQEFHFVFDAI